MPHFQIDYSPNLESRMDIPGFCRTLRDAAVETGVFPTAGIRVRAVACDHVVMADGDPAHAFMDISVRLRGGRDFDTRKRAIATLFERAEAYCAEVMESSSFMLSMEMRDIDPELSPKASSIRKYLKDEVA